MKTIYIVILCLMSVMCGCGRPVPRDTHGNSIFNSRPLLTVNLTNCTVDVNYYTISNNIENPGSAFFVAEKPTPEQVVRFATETPAFFFIIHSNRSVRALVTLEQHPRENRSQRYAFRIIRDPKRPGTLAPLECTQDIPDLRAYEMANGPWDRKAELKNEQRDATLIFNGHPYSTLPLPVVMEHLEELILDQELYKETN